MGNLPPVAHHDDVAGRGGYFSLLRVRSLGRNAVARSGNSDGSSRALSPRSSRGRRFHDRADLERQLVAWLTDVNTVRPSRATGIIPAVRLAEERARLRPLPIAARAYALKIPVVVSAQGRIRHAGVDYSMPADTLGQTAALHLYEDRVEIVTKTAAVVQHPRRVRGASILPEHRAALLDRVHGARGQLYFQRQSLWELGPQAEAWLTEPVHRRPAQWRPDVETCFALLQDYGPAALHDAFPWRRWPRR